jgi:23S rRNA (guanine2445-N2)-methyltransferase / 23S rRNA (guanine2069-N7)-methyltransferase
VNAGAGSVGAQMFANRVRKNQKRLGRWIQREGIHCYRLYDADMPEYAVAVDVYEGDRRRVQVQEYQAPRSVDPARAKQRLQQVMDVVPDLLELAEDQLFLKVRKRQKGAAQYEKLASSKRFHEVVEAGHRFLVNFDDYLDTGLFLDHRITRGLVADLAASRHFLNLFAYTGSASVYAAAGGAASTTTVDMSKTYLDWARRNMALNGYTGSIHRYAQANCLDWLQEAGRKQRKFGLIFLDPPSFSTSSRMSSTFDVQRDHVNLLRATSHLLGPDGVLIFSNNLRRFCMDRDALPELAIEDISRATLPPDFERNPKIHNCWRIQRKQ